MLDLTNPDVLERLGLEESDLTGEDYGTCQELALGARDAGFDGLIAPSGALAGETTIVVFSPAMRDGRVREDWSRVQRPPRTMLAHLQQIRLRTAVGGAVRRLYDRLAGRS